MHHHANTERLILIAGGALLFGTATPLYFRTVRVCAEVGLELSVLEHVGLFVGCLAGGVLAIVAFFLVLCACGYTAMGLMSFARWVRGSRG